MESKFFSHLKDEFREIYYPATKSEEYVLRDPEASAIFSRKALELFIKWAFDNDDNLINPIKDKISGLGIETHEVDGHNIDNLVSALKTTDDSKNFSCILANTVKGKGASVMENKKNWHYWSPMTKEEIEQTREDLK